MIAVIIPALNEEEAIKEIVEGFPDEFRGHKVERYVIDGGSSDSTRELAKESGATVIEQRLGGGKGDGLRQALNQVEADIYVMIDGDGTYNPGEVEQLVTPILEGEAEHVIGRRSNREKGSIPRLNLLGNYLFNMITSLTTGKRIHDMLSGYRAFTSQSLKDTALTRPGFGIETEMTFTALENHVRIKEVEVSYAEREGQSKLHPIKDGWRIINTIIWSVRDLNPLKFFSLASILALAAASYPAYLTLIQKLNTGRINDLAPALMASVLIILAIQLFIFGMLADQVKNAEKRLKNRIQQG